jgi:CDP-6-deoxy-D-xylo-4-hexulose-3-dehydrase
MIDKEKILTDIAHYIWQQKEQKTWTPGKDFVNYAGPFFDEHEIIVAVRTLLDGWLVMGDDCARFERKFPSEFGKKYGIITNSGSSSNLLMMASLTSKRGHNLPKNTKVLVPIAGFPTTLNPTLQVGFEPVFVDIEIDTLNLNLDHVVDMLEFNPDIRVITFAHVLGNPPNMDCLMDIVKHYNLILLEDCCDALGSTYDDKPLGSFGEMASCSFYPAHHMTMGEGGFVAVNSAKKRMALASLRDWGRACYCNTAKPGNVMCGTACGCRFDSWFKEQQDISFDHRYVFEEIGYNLKPTEMQASIGLAQIDKLDEMHSRRKHNFKRLYKIFSKYPDYFYLPTVHEKADPSWFGYLVTLKDTVSFTKANLIDHMESCKIQTRSYFTGNALFHPAYEDLAKEYENPRTQFPIATKTTLDTFFLGVYPGITDEQLDYIEIVLDNYIKNNSGIYNI